MHAAFALTRIQPPRLRPGLIARPPVRQQRTPARRTAPRVRCTDVPAGVPGQAAAGYLARLQHGPMPPAGADRQTG